VTRLIPDTLAGRTIAVLLAGLIAFHVFSIWVYQIGAEGIVGAVHERNLAEQLANARRAVSGLPAEERDRAAHALAGARLDVHWSEATSVRPAAATNARVAELRRRLLDALPELHADQLRLGYADEGMAADGDATPHAIIGALQLQDGSWMSFTAAAFRPIEHPDLTMLISTTAMAIGIVLVSVLVVRSINRPLRELAQAADRVGRVHPPTPVSDAGPREVRHAARAFNDMQARIARLIADRTQALAAVSHDLKTPITRLRLRAGLIEDAETQAKIDADLDEMEAMIESTLAYLRGETDAEPPRAVDLVATLVTLCNAATDTGADVRYDGPAHARLVARPLALKRAIGNLIDNAVAYGRRARVSLRVEPTMLGIVVDDDGPGIPEAEHARVFEPFYRLEASRSRKTGGSGLGLTIARQVVDTHRGTLTLANRTEGGLRVTIRLPREHAPTLPDTRSTEAQHVEA
jgi:signal transduction histidine kinase